MSFARTGSRRPLAGRRQPPSRWRWTLECLEDRTVPAGNVLADQVGSTLTLVGDELGNRVRLLPGGQPNEVVVVGDGTTVNGAARQVFTGVENLFAHLLGGDDSLRAEGLVISAPSFSQVFVDGNAGDDRIELIDTAIHAVDSVEVQVYGERVFETFASGTTGNDTIRLAGTSITSQAFVAVRLYGETNEGGVVTGGNDTITIDDSVIRASGGFFHQVSVEVVGDSNSSLGGTTSTIGGGNDRIAIRDTTIAAASDAFSFGNAVSVTVVGDSNSANGFDPNTFSGADATATIGGGNDRIDVTNTTIGVSGVNTGTSQTGVMIVGDRNFASGAFPGTTTAAAIGGGDDRITVADSTISTTGAPSNGTFVEIRGEDIQVGGPDGASTTSTVGGGNDSITVANTPVIADGPFADGAALVVRGEYTVAFGPVTSVVGGGNDRVSLHNVQLPGTAIDDFRAVIVEAGSGDDRVDIAGSGARFFTVDLGDGDDELRFNTNAVGEEASLGGGPGTDRLQAHDNTGLLVWFGFEEENVTP